MKMKNDFARHSIPETAPLREALKALNALSGESMTLFVLSDDSKLSGTVTDGDIRRGILRGFSLDSQVGEVMNRSFTAVRNKEELREKIKFARRKNLSMLPVIEDDRLIDIIDLNRYKTVLPVDAVMMAGGSGERLRPMTDSVPKPLLQVGGVPIIEYNLRALESNGIEKIFITINYLADVMKRYFDQRRGRADINCVEEPCKLGTIGSLSLIDTFGNDHVLVMNSDLLTEIDFEGLYDHHIEKDADITVATVPYSVRVPFAIMKTSGDRVTGIEEKPTFNYFANAGVYLIRRRLIGEMKKGEYKDAPDFITECINTGSKVTFKQIEGLWIDIGSPDDFRYAEELMKRRNQKPSYG